MWGALWERGNPGKTTGVGRIMKERRCRVLGNPTVCLAGDEGLRVSGGKVNRKAHWSEKELKRKELEYKPKND